jgi:ERCC4-type nuclease
MIIVDTREQKPLWDVNDENVLRLKLDEGDYTTTELLGKAHIERKNGIDLYGSIIQGHIRFREEIKRAAEKDLTLAIFVECPEKTFFNKRFKGGHRLHTPPATLRKIITSIQERYNIKFIWCEGRADMKKKAEDWFDHQRQLKYERE